MKKIYIKPDTEIICGVLCASPLMSSGVYSDDIGTGYGGVDDGTHDPSAKKGFFFDEDRSDNNNLWDGFDEQYEDIICFVANTCMCVLATNIHTPDWQMHFARLVGIRTPVVTIKTKALFDERYSYVMVRQVICYNKAGKQVYNSGEDGSAGWYPVNASDPVGIVGEYLDNLRRKAFMDSYR